MTMRPSAYHYVVFCLLEIENQGFSQWQMSYAVLADRT